MPRRVVRNVAEMPLARIDGRRWAVAMCETEWVLFVQGIAAPARNRLRAILEHFCQHGEDDLPRGCFRWLSSSTQIPGAAVLGTFEAHGVVLRGRAARIDERAMFYVTAIDVDPSPEPSGQRPKRSRKRNDPRQERLPFPPRLPNRSG